MGGPGSGRRKGSGKLGISGKRKPGLGGLHSSKNANDSLNSMKRKASGKEKSMFFPKPNAKQLKTAKGRVHYLKKAGY